MNQSALDNLLEHQIALMSRDDDVIEHGLSWPATARAHDLFGMRPRRGGVRRRDLSVSPGAASLAREQLRRLTEDH